MKLFGFTEESRNLNDLNYFILDAIPGSGKTTFIRSRLKEIGQHTLRNFIFVTPYLDEIQVTLNELPWFKEPEQINGRKLDGLKELLRNKEDICTTHALFLRMDNQTRELLKLGEYELILDETVSPVSDLQLTKKDFNAITDGEDYLIEVGEDGIVNWKAGDDYEDDGGQFAEFYECCNSGEVKVVNKKGKNIYFMWTMGIENFLCFKMITVLTFMWEASYLCGFLNQNGYNRIPETDSLEEIRERELMLRNRLKSLVTVYEGRYNDPTFDHRTSLSYNWFGNRKNKEKIITLSKVIRSFLEYHMRAKKGDYIWTTFLSVKAVVGGGRFGSSFIACNTRATNDYRDRSIVVYAVNRFLNPNMRNLFGMDSSLDDQFALSEIVQLIFRSAVRMGKPIVAFIPSKRMRDLFIDWLEDKEEERS